MVLQNEQLVVANIPEFETPVMAWIRELSSKPGVPAVVCVTPEGFEFEADFDVLEVVHVKTSTDPPPSLQLAS